MYKMNKQTQLKLEHKAKVPDRIDKTKLIQVSYCP